MKKRGENRNSDVMASYHRQARKYDLSIESFDRFARFGFDISGWRRRAVAALDLQPGDTVVDIGCGTGLNFPLLYDAVTSTGRIIGIDLSRAMLDRAQRAVADNHWNNIQLVCADAARYRFPARVDAVVSTYTLILVPGCAHIVSNAHAALSPGGRLAVLDMAWPSYCPLWWRHVLFFLRTYGVTADVLRRRSWDDVQRSMKHLFQGFCLSKFWFGFFYLACGIAGGKEEPAVRRIEV